MRFAIPHQQGVSMDMWKQRQKEVTNFLDIALPSFQYAIIKQIITCPDFQRSLLANEGVLAEISDDDKK